MKKLIILNHKMNLKYDEALSYINSIKNNLGNIYDVIICPSSIYLNLFKDSGYEIGSQNVYCEDNGAYTGEISPMQLQSMGIKYTIIGHSERRYYFIEDDSLINKKIASALKNNISPILCIGEKIEEKESSRTELVLESQLLSDLNNIDIQQLNNVIIAYEPVWAIGSGQTPTMDGINNTIKYIKDCINKKYNINLRVLYGGSVNKDNISEIMKIESVDGVLVGGASIDASQVLAMSSTN